MKKFLILILTLLVNFNVKAGYENCYMGTCYDTLEEREAARESNVLKDRYDRLNDPYHISDPNLEDY